MIKRIIAAFSKWRNESEPTPKPEFWAHVWSRSNDNFVVAGYEHKVQFMDENETHNRMVHYDGRSFYVLHPATSRRYDLVYA